MRKSQNEPHASKIPQNISNFIGIPQCTALSKRSQERCKNHAMRGKTKCRMHGGKSTGPKTTDGLKASKIANLKHGKYTAEMIKEGQLLRDFSEWSEKL